MGGSCPSGDRPCTPGCALAWLARGRDGGPRPRHATEAADMTSDAHASPGQSRPHVVSAFLIVNAVSQSTFSLSQCFFFNSKSKHPRSHTTYINVTLGTKERDPRGPREGPESRGKSSSDRRSPCGCWDSSPARLASGRARSDLNRSLGTLTPGMRLTSGHRQQRLDRRSLTHRALEEKLPDGLAKQFLTKTTRTRQAAGQRGATSSGCN